MKLRKLLFVLFAILAIGGGAVIAFANWTESGSGSGYAKAADMAAVTTSDVTIATGTLYPGGTADVKVSVTNPNTFPVKVTAVSGGGAVTSDIPACTTGGTGVTFTNATGLSEALTAGETRTITLPNAASMSTASDNTCQTAKFTIPVSITATP